MRIRRVEATRFGVLEGLVLDDLGGGLDLVVGGNESGKSTLRVLIERLLFGFPSRRARGELTFGQEDGGKDFGGSLLVDAGEAGELLVERRPAARSRAARVRVTAGDGQARGAADLEAALGLGPEVYRSVFALDLDRLRDIAGADALEEVLAAGLATVRSPARIEAALEQEAARIFRPKGRTQPVAKLRKRLVDCRKDLRKLADADARYASRREEVEVLEARLEEAAAGLAARRREEDRARLLVELHPAWVELQAARARREELATGTEVPPELGEELGRLATRREEARIRLEEAEALLAMRAETLAALPPPHPVVAQAGPVRALAGRADAIRRLAREREDLAARVREADDALALVEEETGVGRAVLAELEVPARTVARLEELERAHAAARRDLAAAEEENRRAAAEVARARRVADALDVEFGSAWHGSSEPGVIRAEAEGLRILARLEAEGRARDARAAELREAARRADEDAVRAAARAEEEWETPRAGADLLAFAGLAGGLASGPTVGGVGTPVLVLGAGIGWLALRAHQRASARRRLAHEREASQSRGAAARARQDLEALEAEGSRAARRAREIRGRLGPSGTGLTGDALIDAEARAGAALEVATRRAEARGEVEAREEVLAAADAACAEADEAAAELEREAEELSVACGLPAPGSPAEAVARVLRAREGRRLHEELAHLEERLGSMEGEAAAVEDRAEALARDLGLAPGRDLGARVAELEELLTEAEERAGEHREASRDVREAEAGRARELRRGRELEEQVEALLARAGVADEEALRAGCERARARERAEEEAAAREEGLRARLGEAGEEVLAALGSRGLEELEARLEEAEAATRSAEASGARLREELGEAGGALRALAMDAERADLLQEEAELTTQLGEAAGRWAVRVLAAELSRRVRRRYEEERQPAVVEAAGRVFAEMTEGAYPELLHDPFERTLAVRDAAGEVFAPEQLSRGTQELLYLAHRVALIRDLATRRRRVLPVLLDDVLVNLDPARARAGARGIAELARTHQVLFFTCHPWVEDLLAGLGPGTRVHRLD